LTDNHPSFGRSLAGGGRYNGLGSIFGCDDLPAVGLGSGDEPMMVFLTNWNLMPDFSLIDKYYMPWLE
jgi:histidyl-tRNA synthetase